MYEIIVLVIYYRVEPWASKELTVITATSANIEDQSQHKKLYNWIQEAECYSNRILGMHPMQEYMYVCSQKSGLI